MQEKENILEILEQTKKAVREKDTFKLKELSNRTVHTSSIYQDPDNITIAIIVYALGKLIQRREYQKNKSWNKFFKIYILAIDKSIIALKNNDTEEFRKQIKLLLEAIEKVSGNLKEYIKDVFRKARINKASSIYEHGISIEQTAKLLGITIWELAEYAGQSGRANINLSVTKDIKDRVNFAMEMFK